MAEIRVEAAGPEHLDGLRALFDAAASPCHCRYWHFTGTKNEWLDRCAHRPEENAAELAAAVREGRPDGRGLVALAAGATDRPPEVVGWMKLVAREHLPKLRALPVYRSLPLEDGATTLAIGCLLVRPDARGEGVARALVEAAPRFAGGARAIEGYPRRSNDPLYPEEVWQGPERLFRRAGFVVAHDAPAYPVYRKVLPP